MDKTFRWGLVVVTVIAVAGVLWPSGIVQAVEKTRGTAAADRRNSYWQMGPGSDNMPGNDSRGVYTDTVPYGPHGYGGMMGNMGMMGMMGSNMMGHMGMMGQGFGPGVNCPMMGSSTSPQLYGITPLSVAQAETAVQDYLAGLDNDDLILSEVMIFDNHAYAQIVEQSTGVGALELLIDPITLAVLPEPGPNMMWNTKYGHMGSFGMMGMMGGGIMQPGGMMGGQPEVSAEMPVGPADASQTAQRYLDAYLPGATADAAADAFYGYYTFHILRDEQIVGMLSVNGYTRQVFVHTWHGAFIEMSEEQE